MGILLLVGGALGLVLVSFTNCAVAEITIRMAVRVYVPPPGTSREDKLEEWIDVIRQLEAAERPTHAGTLLWAAVESRARWCWESADRRVYVIRRLTILELQARALGPLSDVEPKRLAHIATLALRSALRRSGTLEDQLRVRSTAKLVARNRPTGMGAHERHERLLRALRLRRSAIRAEKAFNGRQGRRGRVRR
jgi:hypothetical protein